MERYSFNYFLANSDNFVQNLHKITSINTFGYVLKFCTSAYFALFGINCYWWFSRFWWKFRLLGKGEAIALFQVLKHAKFASKNIWDLSDFIAIYCIISNLRDGSAIDCIYVF